VRAYVGLGSNLGDRAAHLLLGLPALSRLPKTHLLRLYTVYETDPVGPPQPPYPNMVAELETELSPKGLLAEMLRIEKALGRERREADAGFDGKKVWEALRGEGLRLVIRLRGGGEARMGARVRAREGWDPEVYRFRGVVEGVFGRMRTRLGGAYLWSGSLGRPWCGRFWSSSPTALGSFSPFFRRTLGTRRFTRQAHPRSMGPCQGGWRFLPSSPGPGARPFSALARWTRVWGSLAGGLPKLELEHQRKVLFGTLKSRL
jgi:7,8-dihydro-6-hydroxymethylpterin- pyrophosphokinase